MLHLWNHSHTKSVIRIYKVHIEFHSKDYTSISVSSTSNLAYNLLVASIESSSNLLSSSFSDRHLTSYNFVYSSLPISLYRLYLRLQTRFRSWILNFSLGWKTTFFFFSFCEKISKIRILNILTFIDQFIPWKSKLFLLYRKWIKKKIEKRCILDRNSDSLFILGKHKGKMGYCEGEIRRSGSIIRSDKDTAIIQARLFRV